MWAGGESLGLQGWKNLRGTSQEATIPEAKG